jgi:hypothetical protein
MVLARPAGKRLRQDGDAWEDGGGSQPQPQQPPPPRRTSGPDVFGGYRMGAPASQQQGPNPGAQAQASLSRLQAAAPDAAGPAAGAPAPGAQPWPLPSPPLRHLPPPVPTASSAWIDTGRRSGGGSGGGAPRATGATGTTAGGGAPLGSGAQPLAPRQHHTLTQPQRNNNTQQAPHGMGLHHPSSLHHQAPKLATLKPQPQQPAQQWQGQEQAWSPGDQQFSSQQHQLAAPPGQLIGGAGGGQQQQQQQYMSFRNPL